MEIIKQGQYYICVKDSGDHNKGDIVLVTEVYPKEVHYSQGLVSDMQFNWVEELHIFLTYFILDPDGGRKRNERIDQLLTEIDRFDIQQAELLTTNLGTGPTDETGLVKASKLLLQKRQLAAAEAKIHHINKDHPCTPEEQAGLYAEECPQCKTRTLHQYCKQCMICGFKATNYGSLILYASS